MIVDAKHKIRSGASKSVGQSFKITDFKIMIVIWSFIVGRIKKKESVGLVVSLDERLPQ